MPSKKSPYRRRLRTHRPVPNPVATARAEEKRQRRRERNLRIMARSAS